VWGYEVANCSESEHYDWIWWGCTKLHQTGFEQRVGMGGLLVIVSFSRVVVLRYPGWLPRQQCRWAACVEAYASWY